MKSIRILLLLLVMDFPVTTPAQPQVWEVYTTSNQPFVGVIIDRYRSDSLYMKFMNQTFVLHQDSIRYLVRKHSSQVGMGLILGAIVGGVSGSESARGSDDLFSPFARLTSITAGIVVGAILGGAIGSAAGADTRYQIDTLDPERKRKVLTRIFPADERLR